MRECSDGFPKLYVGCTYSASFTYSNADGTPFSLSGATIFAGVKRNYTDPTYATILSASIQSPPQSGSFALCLAPSDSLVAGLSGSYKVDVIRTDSSGTVWADIRGEMYASPTVLM